MGKVFEMSQKDGVAQRVVAKKYIRICHKILKEEESELSPS